MQAVADVRVVPAKVPRIHQHRIFQTEIFHLLDLVFDGSSHRNREIRPLWMRERELGVQCPDLQVRVDDQPALRLQRTRRERWHKGPACQTHAPLLNVSVATPYICSLPWLTSKPRPGLSGGYRQPS